jgi:hypothetical protein
VRYCIILILVTTLLFACSDKYQSFRSFYHFKSADGKPDYSSLDYWAAHPWKWDPSDSVPSPLKNESRDSVIDVFFLHPTTFTKKKWKDLNAAIDDDYISARTDYSTILYQASVFNQHARVFAPRYRQGHIRNFFLKDTSKAQQSFSLAYDDIATAFKYYLQHWNNGRPFIIASHSQGSMLAERLIKEFIENKPLQKQLVAAYIVGWGIPKKLFTAIPLCTDPIQTGCICGWRTLKRGYVPFYIKDEHGNSWVTNPISWTAEEKYIPRKQNKGSILFNFNRLYMHTTGAQISNGLLYVKKPVFPWSFLIFKRNYHIGDINLYYIDLRENIEQRVNAYLKSTSFPPLR